MKHIVYNVICVVIATVLTGCSGGREYVETEVRTIALSDRNGISVSTYNGTVTISEDRMQNEVRVEIVKRISNRTGVGNAAERAADITLTTGESDGMIDIAAEYPRRGQWRYIVDFNIIAPPGLQHEIDVSNGAIVLDVSTTRLSADVGNGNVNAGILLEDNGSVYIGVGNGNISLTIPADTDASLDVNVGSGSIETSGLDIRNRYSTADRLTGDMGSGNGSIRLLTGNGDIRINAR